MSLQYYYNLANNDLVESLMLAIQFHDWQAFLALVSAQENINAVDNSGSSWTFLMYAVFEESLEMVKVLIQAGADVNIRGSDPKEFPLNLAALGCENILSYRNEYDRNKEIFDYLAPLTSLKLREIATQNLPKKLRKKRDRFVEEFLTAAENNRLEPVQKAIADGINVNAIGVDGEMALHKAAWWGHVEIAIALIEAGCNLNVCEEENRYTPLIYAVRLGDTFKGHEANKQRVAQLLIEAGADIHAATPNGRTALIEAVQTCNIEAIAILIEAGADIHAKDRWGDTALSYAKKAGYIDIVRLF